MATIRKRIPTNKYEAITSAGRDITNALNDWNCFETQVFVSMTAVMDDLLLRAAAAFLLQRSTAFGSTSLADFLDGAKDRAMSKNFNANVNDQFDAFRYHQDTFSFAMSETDVSSWHVLMRHIFVK